MSQEVEDFAEFVKAVAAAAALRVEQLGGSNLLPCAMLERKEFRKDYSGDEFFCEVETFTLKSKSSCGEECRIEAAVNMVRVSLRLQWEGPDACVLSEYVQSKFFIRLARWSSVACLRKEPLPGFDVSFIFTPESLGSDVEAFILEILPVWRQLTKQIRLLQIVENRKLGLSLFGTLSKVIPPKELTSTPKQSLAEILMSAASSDSEQNDWLSTQTEIGEDVAKLQEIDDLLVQQMDHQFII